MEALIAALGVCFHVMCFYLLAPNSAAAERGPGRLSSPKRLTPKSKQNQTEPHALCYMKSAIWFN